jgi:DNA-binding transcriptional LysR family regulator
LKKGFHRRLIAQATQTSQSWSSSQSYRPGFALLVPADQPHHRAGDLLKEGAAGKVPLISLQQPHELLPRLFQKETIRRNIVWRTAMETSSQDSVSIYVRNGLGVGLAVQTPELLHDKKLRVIPLSGFPTNRSLLAREARRDRASVR